MQINFSNLNFNSRNPEIRYADDIARKVNCAFPRVSHSRIKTFNNIDKFHFLDYNLREKTRQMRNLKSSKFDYGSKSIHKLLAFLNPTKEKRIGNCGETAQIAVICAKLNKINDGHIAVLRTKDGKKLDHAVLFVQNNSNPYIIDPWIGCADYIPKMLEKYTCEYRKNLNIPSNIKAKDLCFTPHEDSYSRFLKKEIKEEDRKQLLELYPELLHLHF